MNYQKGNALILLVLVGSVAAVIYLSLMKQTPSQKKEVSEDLASKISLLPKNNSEKKLVNNENQLTQPENTKLPSDEVLNPFNTIVKRNLSNDDQKISNDNQKNKIITSENLIKKAPNGLTLPNSTTYLSGYDILNQSGRMNITIDNSLSQSNIIILLYFKKSHYNEIRENKLVRAVYIQSGDSFVMNNLDSGEYQLQWIDLSTKQAYKNKAFSVYQDHIYAYDRTFVFSNNQNLNKDFTHIDINKIYK
jgi:hypothetical protein